MSLTGGGRVTLWTGKVGRDSYTHPTPHTLSWAAHPERKFVCQCFLTAPLVLCVPVQTAKKGGVAPRHQVWSTDVVLDKDSTVTLVSPQGSTVATASGLPYRFEVDVKPALGHIRVFNVSSRQQALKKWSLTSEGGLVRCLSVHTHEPLCSATAALALCCIV
jgi:hypothetical protein